VIYIHAGDRTRFAVGRPGAAFSSLASPPIAAVGIELDRKLANLLEALDVPARCSRGHPRSAAVTR
jgi:hypothetical protein